MKRILKNNFCEITSMWTFQFSSTQMWERRKAHTYKLSIYGNFFPDVSANSESSTETQS